MRSSSLSTIVCLAVAVIASPTPVDPSLVQARDAWSSPVRRDVFLKRSPEPEPQPEIVVDKRSPFTLTPNNIPSTEPIGEIPIGGNGRLPFFLKRDGKLQARDIEALQARKADIEQRQVEELLRREAEEFARREAEEFARREAEDLPQREAEELVAREIGGLQKRAAIEEIEARELELESVKREYEEMFRREYEAEMQQREFVEYESRDLEAREPLSFTLPRNMAVSGRRLPFDLTVTLEARDFDDESTHIAKRDPQFNIASLISQLRGNATASGTGTGGNTAASNALSRLSALFGCNNGNSNALSGLTTALNRFGFNFRREEELARELAAREPAPFPFSYAEATHLSKRDPQFNIASLISQLRGNATANAGGNSGSTTAASRLSALTNGRLASLFGGSGNGNGLSGLTTALSRFGFNFRREEELARELAAREASPFPFSFKEDTVSRRDPFDFDAFVKARR